MKLIIKGGTKRRNDLIKSILSLSHNHLTKDEKFTVHVVFRQSRDFDGACGVIGKDKFLIEINRNLTVRRFIEVLIHEFTHAKQTLLDNCITECSGVTYWRGKKFSNRFIRIDYPEYWTAPWEIEAVGVQHNLISFIEHKLGVDIDDMTWLNCQSLIHALKDKGLRK